MTAGSSEDRVQENMSALGPGDSLSFAFCACRLGSAWMGWCLPILVRSRLLYSTIKIADTHPEMMLSPIWVEALLTCVTNHDPSAKCLLAFPIWHLSVSERRYYKSREQLNTLIWESTARACHGPTCIRKVPLISSCRSQCQSGCSFPVTEYFLRSLWSCITVSWFQETVSTFLGPQALVFECSDPRWWHCFRKLWKLSVL